MFKSELISHLQSNLDKYGDGAIKVEVIEDLNFSGKVYEISDVTNAAGFEFEEDYITVIKQDRCDKEYLKLKAFYDYFSDLYGQGLEVANWHLNGDLESFDSFFDSAEDEMKNVQ